MNERCEATLPGVGWQCERPPHSSWDHHEARRIEWYDVPTSEERAARAAEVTRQTFVIGYGVCEYCERSVSTYDGTCTRCFSHVRAEG